MTAPPDLYRAEAFSISAYNAVDSCADFLGWAGFEDLARRARSLQKMLQDLQQDMYAELRKLREEDKDWEWSPESE